MEPVAQDQEAFTFTPGAAATTRKSRYVFDAGDYAAKITSVAPGTAKSGQPKYVIAYVLLEGTGTGLEFQQHLSTSEAAQWKVLQVLEAGGVAPSANGGYNIRELIGKRVIVTMKPFELDSGKTVMQVDRVKAAPQTTSASSPTVF